MKNITTVGIDLAKNIFQLHGMDKHGNTVLQKKLTRNKLSAFIAKLPPCLIGMESCSGAHHWARLFTSFGHEVKLMPPQYVKPYIKTNKNDANDALGCAEAVTRPHMRFVPIKTIKQHDIQALHRIRSHYVSERTALMNQVRGLLAEYGIVCPKGICHLKNKLIELRDQPIDNISATAQGFMNDLYEEIVRIDEQAKKYEKQIKQAARGDEHCQRLVSIAGFGPLSASALAAMVGNASGFESGRGLSAWLGLVPKQSSSGGKDRLLGISKRGDRYMRQLVIHGARSVIQAVLKQDKKDKHSLWIRGLVDRCGKNKAAVALANKNVRIAWALLTKDRLFDPDLAHEYKGVMSAA